MKEGPFDRSVGFPLPLFIIHSTRFTSLQLHVNVPENGTANFPPVSTNIDASLFQLRTPRGCEQYSTSPRFFSGKIVPRPFVILFRFVTEVDSLPFAIRYGSHFGKASCQQREGEEEGEREREAERNALANKLDYSDVIRSERLMTR